LTESLDVTDYDSKILFTFWSDLPRMDLDKIKSKDIFLYAILKKGQIAENGEYMSYVRGILTDNPKINFINTKKVNQSDLYNSLIKQTLKFFGF
jgi:hypothetical protein